MQRESIDIKIYANPIRGAHMPIASLRGLILAKARSPLVHFRLQDLHLGANGIGFWSYSDTAGSSAWSNLDGHRPDWAVDYESCSGPIPSARWEAFREGVEDLRMRVAASKTSKATSTASRLEQIRHRVNEVVKKPNNAHVQQARKHILLETFEAAH